MSSDLSTRIRGVGPVYIAVERKPSERRVFSRAWIIEMAPPFRKGKGVRLRLRSRAFQIGVCRRHPEAEENLLSHIGWREAEASLDKIRQW